MRLQSLLIAVLALTATAWAADCTGWDTWDLFEPAGATEVRECLEAGLRADARDENGVTPLHLAAGFGDKFDIAVLLKAGAEVDARTEDGRTPLHFACGSSPAAALVLLAAGADVNAQDEDGQTPLYRAVAPLTRPVSPTLIGALLAAGAWVNIPGNSPLHHAARFADNPAVIEALLSAGADASARDNEGKIPWDYAQENEALRGTDAWWRLPNLTFQ